MYIFLILVAILFFITGMVKPNILKWHKKPTRLKVWLYSIVIFFIAMLFLPESNAVKDVEVKDSIISKAKSYEIIETENNSIPGRDRYSIFIISPDAKNFEERGVTALKAAMDFCKGRGAHFVSAYLEVDKRIAHHGYAIAIADYSPDKGGVSGEENLEKSWHVEAMKDDIDESQLKATIIYETSKPKFKKGYDLDSDGLQTYVKKKLGVEKYSLLLQNREELKIESI